MTTNPDKVQLPFATSHAFIVGIDDYQHVSPLHTAVNDARAIAHKLADLHGYTVHPPLLNATHQDLFKLLTEQIPRLVQADDRILFYFAGHGIALDSEEGPNGYLVATNTQPGQEQTLIAMNDLHDALTTLPCRHGLLILDCCFSGAFKWSSGFRDVIFDLPKVIYEERFWRYCKDPAWQVITSAAHDQKAVDILTNQSLGLREEGNSDHTPFASSLLRALDGDGDVVPQGEGDGVITATELYSYLRDAVEKQTTEHARRQSPSIFNLKRHDKGEFIFLNPRHRFNLPPTPDRNPFMGLASYNEADASLFFGRDRVVTALLDKVKAQPLTVVSGASGTGKSSVIKAGVLPILRKEGRTILPIIRPGKEPMTTLATELPDSEQQLAQGAPVLVIDQYEELITQCIHPEERVQFEQQIAQWLQTYPDLTILLSIRSDFEPQFESEALAPWWQPGRYVVPAFSLDEVREVITRPAAQAVLFYEPAELIEQLSEEVSQAPGALPLLSFTLSELYHAYLKSGREDRALTEADYQQLGGVVGALRTRADAEYEACSPAEKSSMRKLMLRMVSLEGGELAGKRVYAEELAFSDAAETTHLQNIADRLVEARLLLKGTDGQGRTYVEPAHDALVRAWACLWEWIKAVGEEKIALQYKLSQAVNDYHELLAADKGKARRLLWNNNPRLDLLQAELTGKEHGLNAREEAFVRTSVKRRTARRRTNWGIAIAVMVGLASLALLANSARVTADQQRARAEEQQLRAEEQQRKAEEQALNATLKSILAETRYYEEQDPLRALRLAELGYQTTQKYQLATADFEQALIRIAYDIKPFTLDGQTRFTEDRTTKTGVALEHTLQVNREEESVVELNQDGEPVFTYRGGALSGTYFPGGGVGGQSNPFSLLGDVYFTDNGKFVIAEVGPEGGEVDGNGYALFRHQGEQIASIYARHYADPFRGIPFLTDQGGNTLVVFEENHEITHYRVSDSGVAELSKIDGFGQQTSALALSPSGYSLAIGSDVGQVKVFAFNYNMYPVSRLTFAFQAHQNESIREISFCMEGKVLKTVTDRGTRYWPLAAGITFGGKYYPEGESITDPLTNATIQFSRDGLEKDPRGRYNLNNKGLYAPNGEVLIWLNLPDHDNDRFIGYISDDGRYMSANGTVYPLEADLILSRINEYQAFGPLEEIDLDYDIPELSRPSQAENTSAADVDVATESPPTDGPETAPPAAVTEQRFGVLIGDKVRLRASPVDGEEITQLNIDTRVEVLRASPAQSDGYVWYEIAHNGQQGWMRSDFIRLE
jgi:hypothetical protein